MFGFTLLQRKKKQNIYHSRIIPLFWQWLIPCYSSSPSSWDFSLEGWGTVCLWSHLPHFTGAFLMFGFEWRLLVKIIYGWECVYNLNVPLDVDRKMYFDCTDLLQGVFFLWIEWKSIFLSLFAWGGAGALIACVSLHEFSNHLSQCSQVLFFIQAHFSVHIAVILLVDIFSV